ncbi:unnamed protein product, partial [Symbiodinium necroappetens]
MCQMRFALGKFAEEHSGAAADFRHVSILHSRFCDCGIVQQRVLNHISEQHERHICVLADINDRLPKEAQSMLDALLPQGVTPSAEIAEAYGNMLKWLQENRSWVFPVQPPHAIWATERLRRAELNLEDLFFSECTPRYPVQDKLGFLEETHELRSITVSPLMLGWPVRRSRLFTCGLNKQSLAWVGPEPEDVQEDFLKFFGVDLQATGDVFLVAEADEVRDVQSKMAARRGFAATVNQRQLNMHEIYAPGHLLRYQDYEKHRAESVESGQVSGESWFADLDQNMGKGASTPGPVLPSCLTHGTLHAWSVGRLVLNAERFLAHGFNMYPQKTGWPLACGIQSELRSLTSSQQQLLLGNGWHLPTLACWVFYVLSHTVKIDRISSIEPEKTLLQRGGSRLSGQSRAMSS